MLDFKCSLHIDVEQADSLVLALLKRANSAVFRCMKTLQMWISQRADVGTEVSVHEDPSDVDPSVRRC